MGEKNILVTGGCGFIGSNFLSMVVPKYPNYSFVNVDSMEHTADIRNIAEIKDSENFKHINKNICEKDVMADIIADNDITHIVNFAAENHVAKSLVDPTAFLRTNVYGVHNLLEIVRFHKQNGKSIRFHQISTDEIYGDVGGISYLDGDFEACTENTPYNPSTPYAATKASANLLIMSYRRSYDIDAVITHCCNNYGPKQFYGSNNATAALIPIIVKSLRYNTPIHIHGDGMHLRDWIYVEDHCSAIETALFHAKSGDVFNISANCELSPIVLVDIINNQMIKLGMKDETRPNIIFTPDRAGNDRRYFIDSSLFRGRFNWQQQYDFQDGLEKTLRWYYEHK